MAPDDPTQGNSGDAPDGAEAPTAQPAPAAAAAPDELRGKDLLSRSREEIAATLDPSTLAQLASWFDRPSAAVIAEESAPDDGETEADLARRARLTADADPKLLAILDRHNAMPDLLLPPWPEIKIHLDERIIPRHVQAALDRMHDEDAPAEARHYETPPDIDAALQKDNAPQAILRDLYRPVEEYERKLVPMFDLDEVAPQYQVGSAMRDLPRVEWIGRALDALIDARSRFTSIVNESWEDHLAAVLARRKADQEAAS